MSNETDSNGKVLTDRELDMLRLFKGRELRCERSGVGVKVDAMLDTIDHYKHLLEAENRAYHDTSLRELRLAEQLEQVTKERETELLHVLTEEYGWRPGPNDKPIDVLRQALSTTSHAMTENIRLQQQVEALRGILGRVKDELKHPRGVQMWWKIHDDIEALDALPSPQEQQSVPAMHSLMEDHHDAGSETKARGSNEPSDEAKCDASAMSEVRSAGSNDKAPSARTTDNQAVSILRTREGGGPIEQQGGGSADEERPYWAWHALLSFAARCECEVTKDGGIDPCDVGDLCITEYCTPCFAKYFLRPIEDASRLRAEDRITEPLETDDEPHQQGESGQAAEREVPEGYSIVDHGNHYHAAIYAKAKTIGIYADGTEGCIGPETEHPTRAAAIAACEKHAERQEESEPNDMTFDDDGSAIKEVLEANAAFRGAPTKDMPSGGTVCVQASEGEKAGVRYWTNPETSCVWCGGDAGMWKSKPGNDRDEWNHACSRPAGLDALNYIHEITEQEARRILGWEKEQQYPSAEPVEFTLGDSGASGMTFGVQQIAKERGRQMSAEGWTAEHDDTHEELQLARNAMAMLAEYSGDQAHLVETHDEWGLAHKHKDNPDRLLEITGALVAAELDRRERHKQEQAEQKPTPPEGLEPAPCPWCGSKTLADENTEGFYVGCDGDGCLACGPYGKTEADAITAWNRIARPEPIPTPTPSPELVEAARLAGLHHRPLESVGHSGDKPCIVRLRFKTDKAARVFTGWACRLYEALAKAALNNSTTPEPSPVSKAEVLREAAEKLSGVSVPVPKDYNNVFHFKGVTSAREVFTAELHNMADAAEKGVSRWD